MPYLAVRGITLAHRNSLGANQRAGGSVVRQPVSSASRLPVIRPRPSRLRPTASSLNTALRLDGPGVDADVVDQAREEAAGSHVFVAANIQPAGAACRTTRLRVLSRQDIVHI